MKLDRSDLRILDELQRDGSLTNAELAAASACRHRLVWPGSRRWNNPV
jgi:DNA-binding Lrp family transcriptional regulator